MRLFLLILFVLPLESGTKIPDEKQLLREGLKLEQAGQYDEALQVWSRALVELETPSLAIGREYIRLATEKHLDAYYEMASTLYLWGFSADKVDVNKESLGKELSMLEPLVDKNTYKHWRKLLEERNHGLYQVLQLFWQNLDPTPATTYNERLVEHWERIAYAREHFDRQDDPPYGTDDRGPVWVRYGQPDRQFDGYLRINRGDVISACTGTNLPCNPEIMANLVVSLHTQPYYDIWIYDKPRKEMEYNLVMIFGEKPLDGFGRVETIDDFIPGRAFTFSKRYDYPSLHSGIRVTAGDSITPGMLMQWLYYKQLATKDFFFADRFDRMAFEWDRVGPNPYMGKYAGPMKEQQTRQATIVNLNKAPEEQSTYEKLFPDIPVEVHQYRLLNADNEPVFATFLESKPQPVFVNDLAANEDSMRAGLSDSNMVVGELFAPYELIHGMQLKDKEGRILSQHRMPAELLLDSTNTEPSSTVFTVPHLTGDTKQLLYAELHNRHPKTKPSIESPFPNSLRGLGRLETGQPEPLSTDPAVLEMGDLLLGYQMQETKGNTLLPFVVANDKNVPEDENLAVHVETYHLQPDPDGIARFLLHYEILPVNWLGWTKERQQEFSLTLNLETDEDHYTEDIEIQTRVLKPGKYVLRMQASQGSQKIEREVEFQVVRK